MQLKAPFRKLLPPHLHLMPSQEGKKKENNPPLRNKWREMRFNEENPTSGAILDRILDVKDKTILINCRPELIRTSCLNVARLFALVAHSLTTSIGGAIA